jgi:hypothetical protein
MYNVVSRINIKNISSPKFYKKFPGKYLVQKKGREAIGSNGILYCGSFE